MEVAFLLCDAAQTSPDGKTHMLGAGWRFCGPAVAGHTVVAFISMTEADVGQHQVRLEMIDADGHPVAVPTPQGPMEIRAEGMIDTHLPDDYEPGRVFDATFLVPVGPGLPLTPGATYVWQLWIDDNTRDDWRYPFYVRAASGTPDLS